MKHTLPRIFLVCLFAAASTVASETNKTAATPVKDYGRGFAKFYKLGLPDAKGGQDLVRSPIPSNSRYG